MFFTRFEEGDLPAVEGGVGNFLEGCGIVGDFDVMSQPGARPDLVQAMEIGRPVGGRLLIDDGRRRKEFLPPGDDIFDVE